MTIVKRSTLKEVPDAFIFMKIGSHAGENLDTILERKQREIDRVGRSFWGYGGATCHPLKQVQPFARSLAQRSARVLLLMEYINSTADPDIVPASLYSVDGVQWNPIPEGINVTGSKWALVLGEIKPGELEVPFEEFAVGIGQSIGTAADTYLKGRVDKACLIRSRSAGAAATAPGKIRKISYVGKLIEPFGVLVK